MAGPAWRRKGEAKGEGVRKSAACAAWHVRRRLPQQSGAAFVAAQQRARVGAQRPRQGFRNLGKVGLCVWAGGKWAARARLTKHWRGAGRDYPNGPPCVWAKEGTATSREGPTADVRPAASSPALSRARRSGQQSAALCGEGQARGVICPRSPKGVVPTGVPGRGDCVAQGSRATIARYSRGGCQIPPGGCRVVGWVRCWRIGWGPTRLVRKCRFSWVGRVLRSQAYT